MNHATARTGRLGALLAPLREDPPGSAVFCDIDGTLAPIVDDPAAAAVPADARDVLGRIAGRYALAGCLSGRPAVEARRLVGIDGLVYIGNHGFERLLPGDEEARPDPALHEHVDAARAFVERLDQRALDSGLRVEDKGPIQALHWRGSPDEDAAEARARETAEKAIARGLVPHWGRKVLEIRPPVAIDKGTALAELLEKRRMRRALYGGDDRTDVDAFRKLRALRATGDLEAAVCVGVVSGEGPAALAREADVVVEGPEGFLEVLALLVAGGGEPRNGT